MSENENNWIFFQKNPQSALHDTLNAVLNTLPKFFRQRSEVNPPAPSLKKVYKDSNSTKSFFPQYVTEDR